MITGYFLQNLEKYAPEIADANLMIWITYMRKDALVRKIVSEKHEKPTR